MDPLKGSGSKPENPIDTCASMLSLRRFSACRDFARRFPPSDSIARILAVADVLSAADFYSVLQLHPSDGANRDYTRRQYAKLALLLDPTSPDKLPFSDEALARVQEAWHVLSRPERRALHDRDLQRQSPTTTFWTACPYCWNLFEYEKRYEDCALLCQVCGKSFEGVPVKSPVKVGDAVVEGEELRQYYSCEASVPLMYYEVKNEEENKDNDILGEKNPQYVYISDDDEGYVRNEGLRGSEKRRMRIKTVAKKVVGSRMRRPLDSDSDLDVEDGESEFTECDDDVFVGFQQGVQHVRSYYNSEAQMIRGSFPQPFISRTYKTNFLKPRSKAEIKLLVAKKHSEAEKRRRMRINGQYETLRNTLPSLIKITILSSSIFLDKHAKLDLKDKASILAETIKQVKELKKKVSKLEQDSSGNSSKDVKFPSGADKLNLEKCNNEEDLVKATLCCEDSPALMSSISRALGSVKTKVVRAEIVSVGGRTRSVLWVQGLGNDGMGMLKSTLKVAMHKPAFKT
ncbi:Transcription factor bHLH131, partial [Mucuna pruriens]